MMATKKKYRRRRGREGKSLSEMIQDKRAPVYVATTKTCLVMGKSNE
jgi:hypothetical protein